MDIGLIAKHFPNFLQIQLWLVKEERRVENKFDWYIQSLNEIYIILNIFNKSILSLSIQKNIN